MTTFIEEVSSAWDYDELKAQVIDWMHRGDLAKKAPEFIALAEDEINTELRIRLMEVEVPLVLAAGARTVALPERFIEPIRLDLVQSDGRAVELRFLSTGQMGGAQAGAFEPEYWSISGENIEFSRHADRDYELRLRMLERFDIAMTGSNALLTSYRGLYLYGALVQASAFIENDQRVPMWIAQYEKLKKRVISKEARSKSLATLRTDLPGLLGRSNFYG